MTMRTKVLIGALVVLVVAGAAGAWWFLRDDAPAEVSLETAKKSVTTGDSSATTSGSSDGIDGTWTVDDQSGSFDFESATGTFAGFRIKENLASIGSNTAVGRTGSVTGTMTVDGATVTDASFEVDLTTITTNDNRRNGRVQDALETDRFPKATFALTSPVDLPAGAADGEKASVTASGDLTIHGVTKPVEFPLQAQLVDGTIVVVGSIDVTFADYGVAVPRGQIVLSVDDHGILELQLLLTRS